MMILTYKSGFVDLEAPIQMVEEQKNAFVDFFEKNFASVEIIDIEEPGKNMGERDGVMKKWTVDELSQLLGKETNERLTELLGRSIMSVQLKRGSFVPDFLTWCKDNEFDVPHGKVLANLISRYLEDRK